MTRAVVVHPDAEVLAEAVAARLLTRVLDLQSLRRPVHLVLTGGTVGIATLAAVGSSPVRDAVDWSGVHLWWGDERFLPDGDPERNDTGARDALLAPLGDALPPGNVHRVPGPSDDVRTPDDAARRYADELAAFAAAEPGFGTGTGGAGGSLAVPAFDVLLLGMGPDGHVASLFPGHEGLRATGVAAIGVHGSPKPPPERVSLTFDALRSAREVWVVAAGSGKAQAVASALAGASVDTTPATGAVGRERTLWLLDVEAAAGPDAGPDAD